MPDVESKRPRGRPPSFDRTDVLARAMRLFWDQGYDGAAIPALSEAMGISPQSLYAAFGSKEGLYREAVDHYQVTIGRYGARALAEEPDAIRAVERLLAESATVFGRTSGTPGCMISTTPLDATAHPLARLGGELREMGICAVERRLRQGIDDGQVAPALDAHAWARYVGSVVQGMSIQARDGASAGDLAAVANIAARLLRSYAAETASA